MIIEFVIGDFARTQRVGGQFQMGERISDNFRVLGLDLAPFHITVEVAVQAQRVIEVAQCNIPLPLQLRLVAVNGEVTVARLMRLRGPSEQHQSKKNRNAVNQH